MSDFDKCPECGETNHYEEYDGEDYIQHFACGFKGDDEGKRRALCERINKDTDDEVGRYRLAMLDAAQVVDTIANDLDGDNAQRCRDLSKQLREFAGHGEAKTGVLSKLKLW